MKWKISAKFIEPKGEGARCGRFDLVRSTSIKLLQVFRGSFVFLVQRLTLTDVYLPFSFNVEKFVFLLHIVRFYIFFFFSSSLPSEFYLYRSPIFCVGCCRSFLPRFHSFSIRWCVKFARLLWLRISFYCYYFTFLLFQWSIRFISLLFLFTSRIRSSERVAREVTETTDDKQQHQQQN